MQVLNALWVLIQKHVCTRTGLQETRAAVELCTAAGSPRPGVSQDVPLAEKRPQTTRHTALTPGRPGRQNTVDCRTQTDLSIPQCTWPEISSHRHLRCVSGLTAVTLVRAVGTVSVQVTSLLQTHTLAAPAAELFGGAEFGQQGALRGCDGPWGQRLVLLMILWLRQIILKMVNMC